MLEVRVTTGPKYIRLSLCDNGPGFSEKQLPLILEAYKNLDQELPTKNHGSGIGLYLSRRLMRRMSGDLKAESAGPGKGACFSLILSKSE